MVNDFLPVKGIKLILVQRSFLYVKSILTVVNLDVKYWLTKTHPPPSPSGKRMERAPLRLLG